jgi:hypothetical protein
MDMNLTLRYYGEDCEPEVVHPEEYRGPVIGSKAPHDLAHGLTLIPWFNHRLINQVINSRIDSRFLFQTKKYISV